MQPQSPQYHHNLQGTPPPYPQKEQFIYYPSTPASPGLFYPTPPPPTVSPPYPLQYPYGQTVILREHSRNGLMEKCWLLACCYPLLFCLSPCCCCYDCFD
ncbi:cysteine-rich and transmembrane domain-containing protein 1-like [Centruroides sculpturatus]|uniref:cysteine-rich and transmembrane domain-containing protein 1-like n=1 Tax=Centruroides sculpturatus TaxID=218467 RepID=UPI000C6E91BE|nr:cysteine-rich and transmembrane domain-containing protein 1-like [Centruroides sculpturatus]XP_023233656.1 cysteine-rich and transmembrane domain-containing protein 1-like [Centruroides sculpturatus]XP_023233660.1 cysteine-rich and transmembrane domain-containing protein 1-like [Centruroides sculpturatus]XP_023242162.1 cysteine-rich and transmembrane domain-containing protein 1-like [Centruroides sculpturatus]